MNPVTFDSEFVRITLEVPGLVARALSGMIHGYAVVCWAQDGSDCKPVFLVTTSEVPASKLSAMLLEVANYPKREPSYRKHLGVSVYSLGTGLPDGGGS